jgi:hypothetical protein
MTVYTTYFDSRFLLRGAACLTSLVGRSQTPPKILVLALDAECRHTLPTLLAPVSARCELEIISLLELESSHPELAPAKANRSWLEYVFTLTPVLCLEAAERAAPRTHVVYIDADLYFFADPALAVQEAGEADIAITEHRFPPHTAYLAGLYGRFNVGWLAFRNTFEGNQCMRDWKADCLSWCSIEPKDGAFGDQMYLDAWPTRYPNVAVVRHIGVNTGPWNAPQYKFSPGHAGPLVNGQMLIAFHFHRVNRLGNGVYETDFLNYGSLTPELCDLVYVPYVRCLANMEARFSAALPTNARARLEKFARPGWTPKGIGRLAWIFLRLCLRRRVVFDPSGAKSAMGGMLYV